MTDQTGPAPEQPPELPIKFRDRELWVRMPTPEQLLVWRRTLKRIQESDASGWNAEQIMIALERSRRVVDTLFVHPQDVEWLDDEMLSGTVTMKHTAEIIQMTVEAFASAAEAEGNREDRRAAKKTSGKKASRKNPDRKVGA